MVNPDDGPGLAVSGSLVVSFGFGRSSRWQEYSIDGAKPGRSKKGKFKVPVESVGRIEVVPCAYCDRPLICDSCNAQVIPADEAIYQALNDCRQTGILPGVRERCSSATGARRRTTAPRRPSREAHGHVCISITNPSFEGRNPMNGTGSSPSLTGSMATGGRVLNFGTEW